ncbi:SemiSWEET transporter [Halarcobacter sp.]|uniref:SemiSWEET transporter n=1 Tax=Halarcobacter sp. TaxID=2321133 RepID=UPI002AA74018|nr:SemiSWEET transporter [Halarcobacter sp.]
MTEILGFIAAILTTTAFIPQVIKVYKTNHTSDLSLLTFLMFTIGVFCWIIYGLILNSYPLIIANIITFLLACYILVKIFKNIK